MSNHNGLGLAGFQELTPEETRHELMSAELNGKVGPMINNMYPGHPWAVSANIRGGVLNIWLGLDREAFGMVIRLMDVATHTGPQMKALLRLRCGELLERYGLPRGRGTEQDYIDLLARSGTSGVLKKDKR